MTASQIAAAVSALLSAILSVISVVDPGGILARPDVQADLVAVFTAAVPLFVALWAYFHHSAAVVAAQQQQNVKPVA